MGGPLDTLSEQLTLAREYALLGSYDTALIFFEGVLAQINKHASNVEDPYIRTKWNKCKKDLMEEFNMVKQIDAERQAFREAPGTNPHPRPSSPKITVAAPSNPYFPVEEIYVPHQSSNDSRSDNYDDPDVWRPPTRVEIPSQYGSRRPTRAGQLAAAAQAKRMASYGRGAGGEKAAPAVGRGNKVTSSTSAPKSGIGAGTGTKGSSLTGNTGPRKNTNARSTPSKRESMNGAEEEVPRGMPNRKGKYEGPDTELAAMLERDVLENSPGVRWEHIAGLTEAKRLLEEAVVLPLWMPEYFQVI